MNLTPLKSIRKYCLWCCNQQTKEVRLCPKTDCPFYPFRMNKKTKNGSLIKVIRQRCLDCGEGTAQAIKKCDFNDCPLFAYRLGKSPAHKKLWQGKCPAYRFTKK